MGETSVPPVHRRDFANIGLDGYAWRLWGSASFSMAAWVACEHGERQNQRVLTTTASVVQSP